MSIALQCEFWAVGQGLFSSGKVLSGGNTAFSWVYDCGSVKKSRSNLMNSIKQMRSCYPDNIDLVVLSHFDEDHISGVAELLKNKQVKYLVIPYFPLWKRLILALEQNISVNHKLFSFYLNPIGYLYQQCEDILKENKINILLLQEVDDIDFPITYKKEWGDNFDKKTEFLYKDIISPDLYPVELLPKGWGLVKEGIEFILYNAPLFELKKQPQNWDKFRENIEKIINSTNYNQQDIENIKAIYDAEFTRIRNKGKKNSEDRNMISTFLYIGPVSEVFATLKNSENINNISVYEQRKINIECVICQNEGVMKNAILYTGDGYLKTSEQFSYLQKALGDKRIGNIFCFQALHHGSHNNWHEGLAQKISPCLTVFSADPDYGNYKHPSSQVVKDFLPYSPILVNQNSYLRFKIQYYGDINK
ncbi:MBL fold metallo-hydrolase [Ursidibacter arcticus]